MSGHTPGPWSFQSSPAHGYRIRIASIAHDMRWGHGDVAVVFFAGEGRSSAQCKADARIIAAAPSMLDRLHADVKVMEEVANVINSTNPDAAAALRTVAYNTRHAISKATGDL